MRNRLGSRLLDGWGNHPEPTVVSRMLWFWLDGAFANGYDSICTTYLAVYIVSLGATNTQVGLMSSLGSLTAALLLLPGALITERWGYRKSFALWVGLAARLMLLGLAGVPLLLSGQPLIFAAIAFSVLRDGLTFLGNPAWVSLSADIVPAAQRGRYFSSRTFASTLVGVIAVFLAGSLITAIGIPNGYMVAFVISFCLGIASSIFFSRIHDPHPEPFPRVITAVKTHIGMRKFLSAPAFIGFCLTSALFNFSLNLAGPFFNIHLMQGLHATPTEVGLLTVTSSLSTLLSVGFFGRLADRFGSYRVAMLTGLTIPVLPLAWVFATAPWQIFPINVLSGFLWGGYNLAMFNLLLFLTPDADRARFSAIYQILVTLSLAGGAAMGGWIATVFTFRANFLLSAIGRFIASLLFLLTVTFRKQREKSISLIK
jgi:MFS family permease